MGAGPENEINVALTANFSELAAGMTGGAEAVKAGTTQIRSSFEQFTIDAAMFDNAVRGNITSLGELAAAESALDRIQASGVYSAEELTAAFKGLDLAEKKITKSALESVAAIGEQTAATAALGGVSAGTSRELAIMTGEALRGNYNRLIGSTTVLANRTGLMAQLFSPMGAAIGLTAAATATLVYQTYEAEKAEGEFATALLLTGSASGMTVDDLNGLSRAIQSTTHDLDGSNDALLEIVASGKFTADQYYNVGKAAVEMSHLTGQGVEEVVREFAKLRGDPVKAVVELNEKYHFLTVAVYEHIRALHEEGRDQEAADLGMQAFADHIHNAARRAIEDAHGLKKAFLEMQGIFSDAKAAVWSFLSPTDSEELADLTQQQIVLQSHLNQLKSSAKTFDNMTEISLKTTELAQIEKEIAAIQRRQAVRKAEADDAKKIAGDASVATGDPELDRKKAEADRQRFLEEQLTHKKSLAEELKFWLDLKATATKGSAEYEQALREAVSVKNRIDSQGARTGIAAIKEESAEKMRALQEERNATVAGSEERLAVDKKMLALALQLYKAHSSQVHQINDLIIADHKARNAQMIADDIATDKKETANDVRKLTEAKANADAQRDLDRQAAADMYRDRSKSAEQILAVERKLIADQLAADLTFYNQKLLLDRGNRDAIIADKNAINAAAEKARKDDLTADLRYQQEIRAHYRQTAGIIASTAANTTMGLISGQMTWRDAAINVGQQVLNDFIHKQFQRFARAQADRLADRAAHAASEAMKVGVTGGAEAARTAAVVAGSIARTAAETTAAAASTTLTAGAAIKNIIANAAETFTGIYKAIAAIPYIGPFLAPAMAVAGAAVVIGMVSKVASAEKGWGRVPYDGMQTELHKDEMVLPADLAQGVRSMASMGGKQGGDTHNHFHAFDANSFVEFARRNPAGFARGVKNAIRTGHLQGSL